VFNQGTGTDKDRLLVNISQYTNNTGTDNNSNNNPLNSPLFTTTPGASQYQYQILSSRLSIQAPACCPQPTLITSSIVQYTDGTAFLTYVCRECSSTGSLSGCCCCCEMSELLSLISMYSLLSTQHRKQIIGW